MRRDPSINNRIAGFERLAFVLLIASCICSAAAFLGLAIGIIEYSQGVWPV